MTKVTGWHLCKNLTYWKQLPHDCLTAAWRLPTWLFDILKTKLGNWWVMTLVRVVFVLIFACGAALHCWVCGLSSESDLRQLPSLEEIEDDKICFSKNYTSSKFKGDSKCLNFWLRYYGKYKIPWLIETGDRLGSSWFSISRDRFENTVSLGHIYPYPHSPQNLVL